MSLTGSVELLVSSLLVTNFQTLRGNDEKPQKMKTCGSLEGDRSGPPYLSRSLEREEIVEGVGRHFCFCEMNSLIQKDTFMRR